jgi:peptidoglycan/LPS O-acetylase OafA/YrhL
MRAGILDIVSSFALPHSRGVRVGLALFVLGLAFIAADVLPFFADDHDTPLWLNLACLLAPAGFAIAVWAGLRAGREEQRAALRELTSPNLAP